MAKKINNIDDLLKEKARLKLELDAKGESIQQQVKEYSSRLQPILHVLGFVKGDENGATKGAVRAILGIVLSYIGGRAIAGKATDMLIALATSFFAKEYDTVKQKLKDIFSKTDQS